MKLYSCVTGADRGLGFELAKALLEDGYTVFAGRYNKDWKLLDKLSEKYPDSLYIVDLDVSSDTSVKAAAEFISSRTDRIDRKNTVRANKKACPDQTGAWLPKISIIYCRSQKHEACGPEYGRIVLC